MQEDQDIQILYEKNQDFRTVLATGVYGGFTSNGLLNIHFYTDRTPLPSSSKVIVPDGDKEKAFEVPEISNGPIREVHFGVLVTPELARNLVSWMSKHISEFEIQKSKGL